MWGEKSSYKAAKEYFNPDGDFTDAIFALLIMKNTIERTI